MAKANFRVPEIGTLLAVSTKSIERLTQDIRAQDLPNPNAAKWMELARWWAFGRRAAYIASKGAVESLTRAMQVDYCRYNIRVNSLLPGTIYTPFAEGFLQKHYSDEIEAAIANLKKHQRSGTLGTPQDVAYAALYLASDKAKFVYSSGLVVDGGLTAGKLLD